MTVPSSAYATANPIQMELLQALDNEAMNSDEFKGKISNGSILGTSGDGDTSGMDLINGGLQSRNFAAGSAGWRFDKDGNIEGNNGVFRGTVRQKAVGAKIRKATDSLNVAAGTYTVAHGTTDYNIGGEITVMGNTDLRVDRAATYLIIGYMAFNFDASLAAARLQIEYGTGGPSAAGAALLVSQVMNNQPTDATAAFNLSSTVRLAAGTRIWLTGTTTVQADWLAGGFLSVHYLSEN